MQLLAWKAFAGLAAFDILGLDRNFSRMHRLVSRWSSVPRMTSENGVERVYQAVNRASVWYPKRVRCLQRSAVTTCLLRSHGIHATMVMGIQHLPFKAHAWTEVDGEAVNERRNVQSIYTICERC
jgi:hypothetical protein